MAANLSAPANFAMTQNQVQPKRKERKMFRSKTIVFVGLTFMCCFVCVGNASVTSIPIYSTGQGSNGLGLPVGVLDPHYALVSAPPGVPLTAITTAPNGAWVANTSIADWISPGSDGNTWWPVGTFDYQTTFSLAGLNPATAQLSGRWASDNNACIFLNGVNTNVCTPYQNFGVLAPFTITSGFQPGTNTLDFVVYNGGLPTGVIAEISGTANASAPEPATLLLAASGLVTLRKAARRKASRA